ncbi:hypothetical protein Rhopal_005843-T1 [Rhodotorula paludigena]|uniref:Uncharacterized protein n=1 Tax=Rhodotorula paludigena TaxID=86838 RepID=A0AAV5GTH9_9BASI|nr:hypothetical protein Rhopal_005843-T1 [Rhodotorula paludigena]
MVLSVTFDPLFRDAVRDGNQQPLLLDRLDLTSFSAPAVRAATPPDQLPLKAVYRDAVLGLRYISLSPSSRGGPNQPEVEFRRLQVKFTSNAERERFVEATKALVPAKPAVEAALPATAAFTASPAPKKVSSPAKKAATPRRKKPVTSTRDLTGSSAAGVNALAPSSAHFPPPTPDYARASTSTAQHLHYSSGPTALPGPFISQHVTSPPPHLPTANPSRLPEKLSTLLPNLASTSALASSASGMLAALPPEQFEQLLQEALLEEGFEELVKRVQEVLTGQNVPGAQ